MRRFGLALVGLIAALGAGALISWPDEGSASPSGAQPGRYRDGRGRLGREGSRDAASGPVSLCNAMASGDKSGTWWCMNGDGTTASGSSVTLVAIGSPTNTVENGWPVRSYAALQGDREPADVAFPASDFSVCSFHRSTVSFPNNQLMAFGTSGATATFSVLPFELQTNGTFISYTSNGTTAATFASGLEVLNEWDLLCYTYQRVGGAANNVSTLYVNGVQKGTSSSQKLVQALVSRWSTNGYQSGGSTNQAVRGVFVTYKLLSTADLVRIYAAIIP